MAGIGLAYKLPEDQAASTLESGARAVTQPPAAPGIGMARLPDSGVLTAAANPDVYNDGGPEVAAPPPPAPAAPPAPAPAPAPTTTEPAEKPLIDFHENPMGAIGLVLQSVGAGLDGKESPVIALRKQQVEQQAMQYKQASLGLDVLTKYETILSKNPVADHKAIIQHAQDMFGKALPGLDLRPILTAFSDGSVTNAKAKLQAAGQFLSPQALALYANDPAGLDKLLTTVLEHKATQETPQEAADKAGAVAEAQNKAGATKPMTPAEIAADKRARDANAASQASAAATLAETKAQHSFERDQAGKKPLTDSQANAAMFADRAHEAEAILSKHGKELTSVKNRTLDSAGAAGRGIQGSNYQKASQAKMNFLMAVLRKESGAAIGKDEISTADQQYFPQPGDKQDVINQKAANRATAMAGLSRAAGPTYQPPAPIIRYDAHGNRMPD